MAQIPTIPQETSHSFIAWKKDTLICRLPLGVQRFRRQSPQGVLPMQLLPEPLK